MIRQNELFLLEWFAHCLTAVVLFLCRSEIKTLRQGVSPKKEKLTEWLSTSIAELRLEISELQASASNLTRSCHQRNLFTEDIRSIRDEMNTFRLEASAIRSRQDKSDVLLRELREEITQSAEDLVKASVKHKTVRAINKSIDVSNIKNIFASNSARDQLCRVLCLFPSTSSFCFNCPPRWYSFCLQSFIEKEILNTPAQFSIKYEEVDFTEGWKMFVLPFSLLTLPSPALPSLPWFALKHQIEGNWFLWKWILRREGFWRILLSSMLGIDSLACSLGYPIRFSLMKVRAVSNFIFCVNIEFQATTISQCVLNKDSREWAASNSGRIPDANCN